MCEIALSRLTKWEKKGVLSMLQMAFTKQMEVCHQK